MSKGDPTLISMGNNSYHFEMRLNSYPIEYIVYMYNLGTAPNVQNWAGFAVCTPILIFSNLNSEKAHGNW